MSVQLAVSWVYLTSRVVSQTSVAKNLALELHYLEDHINFLVTEPAFRTKMQLTSSKGNSQNSLPYTI